MIEQGIDPDAIDYAGTDIEVTVSNRDTLRKQWEEIMEVCLKDQSGQLPGKTIVFAMTKAHAHRVREVFEEMYPQHVGLAVVIASGTERVRDGSYGDGLITKFKKNDLPRIADFGGHARHRHRRARSGQPRLHEARAVADQALANDRSGNAQPGSLPLLRPPPGRS